jgi:hypothetical protein
VEQFTEMLNTHQIASHLLDEAVRAVNATGGALYMLRDDRMKLIHQAGEWDEENASLALPIAANGDLLGRLMLGPRQDGPGYSPREREALQCNVDRVANAISSIRKL